MPKSTKLKRKLDGNLLISLAAIFLSAGTLFILIYQSNVISKQFDLQKKQQLASSYPYLMLASGYNNGDSYRVFFINQGLGPAFIKEISITYKDSLYKDYDYITFLNEHLGKKDFPHNIGEYADIVSGLAIPAGEEFTLLEIIRDPEVKSQNDIISSNEVRLKVVYKSVYDEEWMIDGLFDIPTKIKEMED